VVTFGVVSAEDVNCSSAGAGNLSRFDLALNEGHGTVRQDDSLSRVHFVLYQCGAILTQQFARGMVAIQL
jgi:hypothetical protein